MDQGRLGLVRKRSDYQRKYMFMMNECIRARWEMYDVFLNHEKQNATYKRQRELGGVRQSVVKQRVLQKCLKMRRDGVKESDLPQEFGEYGGLPANALTKDRDKYIAFMHPKLRRLRNVKRNLQQSVDTGAIINSAEIGKRKRRLFRENTIKNAETKPKTNKYTDKEEHFKCTFPDISPRKNDLFIQHPVTPPSDRNSKTITFGSKPLMNQPRRQYNVSSNFTTPRSKPFTNTPRSDTSQTDSRQIKQKNINKNKSHGLILPPIKATRTLAKR